MSLGNLAACSTAPSQNILGSYFPSWMLCAFAGLGGTIIVRRILIATRLDKTLPAPLAVYLAFTVAFAFASWLLWLD
ncbi:MAG TPA: YtcA family lipoprotein [Aliidongia sp.]|nr:YtcA family lipoprotein [Aliidongia sp.]